jgi:Flp pilus assembly protein TadD
MRKALIVLGVLVLLVVVVTVGIRRVPAGAAAWNAARGELRVAGAHAVILPRFGWQVVDGGPVACEVTSSSREGANVSVRVVVTFPPGRYRLLPAATPPDGVSAALTDTVRERIGSVPMMCLAGLGATACPEDLEATIAGESASRLKVPAPVVSVRLVPDAEAVAAARRAALKEMVGRPPRRVLVVGWDGADWEVIGRLARQGAMPNLARLMAAGAWGDLASFTPLLSPLIWTTMATGVGPEEHGVLDFVEIDPKSGEKVPISGRGRRVPALWNEASAAGLTVAVSGWWATWPAEAVNGVMVSDRLFSLFSGSVADAPAGTVVFPPTAESDYRDLARRAEDETGESVVRALFPVSSDDYRKAVAAHRGMADPIDGFRRIMVSTRTYFGADLLASEKKPDLNMVYCIGTDEIGHVLAPYLPPPLPGADPHFSQEAQVAVDRYFEIVDRWLGRLLDDCPLEECAVLIVSDHGFKWGADRPRNFSGVADATAALWHRPHGVFVLAGKGVRKLGHVATAPSVFDVAPTIAALLGLPPGKGWRGTPLPGSPPARREAVDWPALVPVGSYRQRVGSEQPSPEYMAQLKALGYLEGGEGTGTGQRVSEGELNNLGLIELEAKHYGKAEKAFREAIARNPNYASPHYNLRRLYFETGRYDEADRELWAAVALGLRDGVGSAVRAAADYQSKGDIGRAIALLAQGARHFPTEAVFPARELGLLVQSGRCQDGVSVGREAVRHFDGNPAIHAFYGLAAACAGDAATARQQLRRSLRLDPNQPELRQALDSLPPG